MGTLTVASGADLWLADAINCDRGCGHVGCGCGIAEEYGCTARRRD